MIKKNTKELHITKKIMFKNLELIHIKYLRWKFGTLPKTIYEKT